MEKFEEFDYSVCNFIANKMYFISYFDFCDNCEKIKEEYLKFDNNGKLFYRWYVYANIHMNETFKNAIWDYLNSNEIETKVKLMSLKKIYYGK